MEKLKNLKIETIDVSAYCDEQSIFLDDHTVFFYKDKLYTLAREQGSDVYNIWVIFNLKTQLFEHREDNVLSIIDCLAIVCGVLIIVGIVWCLM